MKSTTISYPIDPDALKNVWNINGSNTITKHGNTVSMPLGPITSIGIGGTYLGSNGTYGASPNWSTAPTVGVAPMTVNAKTKTTNI